MNISSEGVAITKRFFEAIDMLKAQKQIRGLQTFTRQYNINRWNLKTIENNPDSSVMKPEYLSYLVRDYGISANWLLTGAGNMLTNCHFAK